MATQADIGREFVKALDAAERHERPFRHWILKHLFPADTAAALRALPFAAPDLDGVSGTREAHNATRVYFDPENQERYAVCRDVAAALQDCAVVAAVEAVFGTDLRGTFLRVEYVQDVDGFWLEPHTDIGVKRYTLLAYLSDEPNHTELGTDLYADPGSWAVTVPFVPNTALGFVPSDRTWHGFRKRPIGGVRKSIIVNYVTNEWRAREQLCFPHTPVLAAAA
ncbi:MAG: 2OG-Fe(II) oxygenase [Hyphomicrobiales bacterium]|nr:2OG-Fe(II) oxygenase [Hyphomicrobiales bacterium]